MNINDNNIHIETVNNEKYVSINGKTHKLQEVPVNISAQINNINFCSFCGAPSGEDPLFTIDKKEFICKNCTLLAYKTFMEHGVAMPLDIKAVTKREKRKS